MGRPVVVACVDGDGDEHILVTVAEQPTEAYASKNNKHLGFIRDGKLEVDKKATVSPSENSSILTTYALLYEVVQKLP